MGLNIELGNFSFNYTFGLFMVKDPRFCLWLGEDLCQAEGEVPEATITAEDLDISAVQPSAGGASGEKPAPKNVFYFYQVPAFPPLSRDISTRFSTSRFILQSNPSTSGYSFLFVTF
jgi:hypothetical protein